MPELPEVQTTVSGLQLIIKKQISSVRINTTKLRYLIPIKLIKLVNSRKILKIYRIAKYIIFELSEDVSLIFHLGMSGRIRLMKINDYQIIKHDHIVLKIDKNIILAFNDPRKFGFIDFSMTYELKNKKYFLKLGLDPFESKLNNSYLYSKFRNSKCSIKQLLLNQRIITGIGNIYACEILYDAKISPFVPGNQLSVRMINRLIQSIRKILKKAILSGGSTLRDYISTDGTLGNFQTKFKVYNKEDEKISKFSIRRIKQHGRSTFFCPGLQKSKYNPINE